MSYKLESDVGCVMGNEVLRFGSLDQVFDNDDDLRSFEQGIEWIDQNKREFKEGIACALNEARTKEASCSNKVASIQDQKLVTEGCSFKRYVQDNSNGFCFVRVLA